MKNIMVSPLLALVLLPPFALAQREQGASGTTAPAQSKAVAPAPSRVNRSTVKSPGHVGPCGFSDCLGRYGFRPGDYGGYVGYSRYPGYAPGYYASYVAPDEFWTLQENPPPPTPPAPATPSVIVMQAPQAQPVRAAAESPKLVEVPLTTEARDKTAANTAPAPPAVFIMANGERLQATQYTLTYDSLQLPQGGRVRVIPLKDLNLDATLAANHEQGFDLKIPANRQQITLGF